jgi:hypothetical protein
MANGTAGCQHSRGYPKALTPVVETYHQVLPLAILAAIVQVRVQTVTAPLADDQASDMVPTPDPIRISCDNFR